MFLGYNFVIMRLILAWKYVIAIAVILGCAVYAAHKDQEARDQYKQKCTQLNPSVVFPTGVEEYCDKGADDAARHIPRWYRIFGWPEGITAWAIILTLFVIADQTRETAKAAKATEAAVLTADKSLVLQEKTSKQQLRAYMVLRRGKVIVLEGGKLRLSMEMENSGQTPAYDFQGVNRSGFATYPRNESWDPEQPNLSRSKGIIGSGRAFVAGGDTAHTQHSVEALRTDPNRVLFITALYTYLDIFKESHFLRIQLVIGGPMGVRLDVDELGTQSYFAYTDVEGNEGD